MSYRAGLSPEVAAWMGVEPGPPRITCDGCQRRHSVTKRSGLPYVWFLDNKAPPKWKLVHHPDGTRSDWCPSCPVPGPFQASVVR